MSKCFFRSFFGLKSSLGRTSELPFHSLESVKKFYHLRGPEATLPYFLTVMVKFDNVALLLYLNIFENCHKIYCRKS